jgi:hypothetical protein
MVALLLDSTRLEVALSATEKALTFHRGNVLIERSMIAKVQLTDDAWNWLRGVPSPGTHVPRLLAMGSWKSAGGVDFAVIRRHRPAVVIDLKGHDDYQRVVLTTRHGLALVTALRLDEVPATTDVIDLAPETAPVPQVKKPKPRKSPKPATA